MSPTNVETVRSFFDAYLRRDRTAVVAVVHPDVEWRSVGGPVTGVGVLHGRDELLTFMFEQILDALPDFEARIEELTELEAGRVLVMSRYVGHGVASGAEVELTTAAIYAVEHGRIVSFREFASRAEAIELTKSQ